MQKNLKASIVPTVLSSKGTLWCVLFVGYFFALVWLYNLSGKIRDLSAELDKPVVTRVETEHFSIELPPQWQEYSLTNGILEIRRDAGERVPFIQVVPQQDQAYAFTALDSNPSVLLRRYEDILYQALGTHMTVNNIGSQIRLMRPGCNAVLHILDIGSELRGCAALFYVGDVRYLIVAAVREDDLVGMERLRQYCLSLPQKLDLPDRREAIERPLVNSNNITSEQNRKTQESANREIALWNLYRDRAKVQPESYLLPAIEHYRQALELMASLREEGNMLDTPDFAEYQAFLKQRAGIVREWFVRLDKLIGMKNTEAAKAQAQYIIEHATLIDESLDVRRASDILASLNPPPPKAKK